MAIVLLTSSPATVAKFVTLEFSTGKHLTVHGPRNYYSERAICIASTVHQANSRDAAWIRKKLSRLVFIEYEEAKAFQFARTPDFCVSATSTLDRIRRANLGGFPIAVVGSTPGQLQEGDTVIATPLRYRDIRYPWATLYACRDPSIHVELLLKCSVEEGYFNAIRFFRYNKYK